MHGSMNIKPVYCVIEICLGRNFTILQFYNFTLTAREAVHRTATFRFHRVTVNNPYSTYFDFSPSEVLSIVPFSLDCHIFNTLSPELNPICYLLALLGAHHFLHVSRIRVKSLTFKLLMSYIY